MKHRVLAIVMCGVMAAAGGLLAGCSHERIVDGIVYSPDTNRDGREEYAIWRVEEGVRVVRPLDELDGRPVTTIWLAGNEEIEEIYFPKHVTFVRDMTIDHCTNLKKVDLNDGLLSIQSLAFTGLPNLHELSIPSSVRQIMQNAFYNDPEGADGHAACTLAINYEGTLEEMMASSSLSAVISASGLPSPCRESRSQMPSCPKASRRSPPMRSAACATFRR